jgi:hypothetical protein
VVQLENPAAVNKRPDADQMGMRSEPGLTDESASARWESSRSGRLDDVAGIVPIL